MSDVTHEGSEEKLTSVGPEVGEGPVRTTPMNTAGSEATDGNGTDLSSTVGVGLEKRAWKHWVRKWRRWRHVPM